MSVPPGPSHLKRAAAHCLIVDDKPSFLEAARGLLEQEGMVIVGIASTAAEAVGSAAELHPEVTLVDIDLGGESGFELARRLADDPGLDPGLLIMISAQAEDDVADLVEASPAIGFVSKSDLSAEGIDRLVRAADHRRNR
jgi:DNA-binding NarL/FixJ family response regulator